ncbi:hypothetical protein CRUP_012780, partial [Coryphaenoides rupestris]
MSGLSYRVLECPDQAAPVAQVDDKGALSSGSLTGACSLLVTAQETFGINQTLVVPVSYLRFSTSPPLHTAASSRETLAAIPLGAVLTFTVHFHASTGETLHSSSSLLTFSTNRTSQGPELRLPESGGTGNDSRRSRSMSDAPPKLKEKWPKNRKVPPVLLGVVKVGMADYLPLPVAHAIGPPDAQTLVMGDVVCFSAQLTSPE